MFCRTVESFLGILEETDLKEVHVCAKVQRLFVSQGNGTSKLNKRMTKSRILVFGGSLRRDSFNQKLAAIAAVGAREAGAEVTLIALRDFPLPVFDQELEDADGLPAAARTLKELFREHHGLLIASPEYNSSISCSLKNVFDWVSRAESDDEPALVAFAGKTAVLCAASPGALGGLRGLVHVRAILGNLGVTVLPDQATVSKAHEAFKPDGSLADEKQAARVKKLGAQLAHHLAKLLA
jgi:chromate reductase, NAD(P)H dehydrogenase (quinone)